jgi:hypothetical protein
MTTTDQSWPPRPPDRVRHGWRCTRRGVVVETIRRDQLNIAQIVTQCLECNGDDLTDRLRAERETT